MNSMPSCRFPGVTNGWTQPIINRINMLSTGIRTDVGVKVYGQNLDTIYAFAEKVKKELEGIDGVKICTRRTHYRWQIY